MSLRFGQFTIAGVECTSINLQAWLGSYSLEVALRFRTDPKPNERFRVSNLSVLFNLAPPGRIVQVCRMEPTPQIPLGIEQYSGDETRVFRAPLHERQLAEIEKLRDGKDLNTRLDLYAYVEQGGVQRIEGFVENYFHTIPVSQWAKTLASSGYQQFISFDLNSGQTTSRTWKLLARAQDLFSRGHYREAVAACRKVMEAISESISDKERDEAKAGFKAKPKEMSQRQRFILIREAVHHALHLAHHDHEGDGRDGDTDYGRDDAEFVLRLTSSCAAYDIA